MKAIPIKAQNIKVGDEIILHYNFDWDTTETIEYKGHVTVAPYWDGQNLTVEYEPIGEAPNGDGKAWLKYGKWQHAAKWWCRIMHRRDRNVKW